MYLKTERLGQSADLRGGLRNKEGGVFEWEGGLIPQGTLYLLTIVMQQ